MPENPIYDFLKANKLTDKDEATFLKEYSDSSKAKELYGFFQANNLTDKDFNGFYDTYLKKKETASPIGGKVGSSVGRLDVGAGITEIDEEGKPIGKALGKVSGITTPEQAKISRVNKAFGKIESFAGSREDFEEIYKQAPQEFDNIAKQVAPNVNKGEIDKFYTNEVAQKDAYVDRVFQSYNQQKTKAQLESARRYRPVIESQFSTATIPLSNYTGKQYQLPQSEAQVSEILSDLNNEKEKLKTELTTNWNLSEVQTKAKELSEIEAAIRQNLTYQVGRMALERLSQNNPNVTSKDIGKEIFRVLHPDEYDLYEKVGGDKPVSFTVGTQRDTPVEADALNEQMVKLGNEIKRMYGNETAIQDADIEEQTAKRKYTFQRQAQVKQKIAAILHERGLSPDKATEELKDKVVNKYLPDEDKEIWYNNNKVYNNVDLPSTGLGYSFKNDFNSFVKDAVSSTFGFLLPNRQKARAAEVLAESSESKLLGEDPQYKARLGQLKAKEEQIGLSDKEKEEKESLETYTNIRSKWEKRFDLAGTGLGTIMAMGTVSAFTGGLLNARNIPTAIKSLIAPSQASMRGRLATSVLTFYESNARNALKEYPNDKDWFKRGLKAGLDTAVDSLTEMLFPEEKILSGIGKREVAKMVSNLTAKNLNATLNSNIFKDIARAMIGGSKRLVAVPLQEGAEELIAATLKEAYDGAINPDPDRQALDIKQMIEIGENTLWSSGLLGVPKALFGGKSNKVPLNALWDSVSTQDGYITQKMTIERLKRDGELTEAEAQDRLDNLELGRNEYLNNPILSGDMGGLDAGQKQNYFARILNEAILKKQADAVTDPNLKKQYEQQIKESEAIREKIYKGEIKVTPENEELTQKEFEKREKEQQIKKAIGLQDKIDDIERRRQEELNQQTDAGYSIIALDYLFTGGRDVIQSTDYFLQALVGGFIHAAKEINDVRNKYANKLGNLKDDINSDIYNQMISEIRDVINKKYNNSKATEIFDKILKNATGFTNREGNQVSVELDKLNEQNESKINAKYDAELAALEQPTIDQDRVLGDEEAVVSQSDEELLTTLQELAQEGVKDQDLQFFVDQAANAPNQFIETYGEQVTQELLDKATTEQIQKGLEDARKFENNPNVSLLEKELERRGKTIADFVAPQEASTGLSGGDENKKSEIEYNRQKELKPINDLAEGKKGALNISPTDRESTNIGEGFTTILENVKLTDAEWKEARREIFAKDTKAKTLQEHQEWRKDFEKRVANRLRNEINEKYDAELAELEKQSSQPKAETPTQETTPVSEPTTPPTTQAKELADKVSYDIGDKLRSSGFIQSDKGGIEKNGVRIVISKDSALGVDRSGDVFVSDSIPENIVLKEINVVNEEARGKGNATQVLRELLKAADDLGKTIFIEPTPIKKYKNVANLTQKQLINWYERHGFKKINDQIWKREPGAKITETEGIADAENRLTYEEADRYREAIKNKEITKEEAIKSIEEMGFIVPKDISESTETQQQPPPPQTPKQEPKEVGGGKEKGERRFTKQMLEDEEIASQESKKDIEKTLEYTRLKNIVSVSEAADVIQKVGVDEAQNFVMNDKWLKGAVRVVLGQVLIRKYGDLAVSAKDEETRNYYYDKQIQTATFVTEKLATEPGQMIQAFSLWSELSPEAQLRDASKDLKKQGEKKLKKRKKDIDNIGNKFNKANEDAATEAVRSVAVADIIKKDDSQKVAKAKSKIAKARERRANLIKKYKKGKGGGLTLSTGGLTKEGIEFIGEVAKTYIDEGIANIELLVEKAVAAFKDVTGNDPDDKTLSQIKDESEKQLNKSDTKLISGALSDKSIKISEIVKQHYTVVEKAKKSLAQKLMDEAGLEQSNAQELAQKVEAAFDRIATKKKRDILYREKARFDKINRTLQGSKKVEKKTVADDIIRYTNLGAFNNQDFSDMLSEKFGLGQISPEQADKLQELANKVQKSPEGTPKRDATEDLLAYRAKLRGNDLGETAQAVWYANVLSGYKTQEKNIVSTFFQSMGELVSQMEIDPKAIPYIIAGYVKGVSKRGFIEALNTLTTGRSPIHIKKVETPGALERKRFKGGNFNPANWFKYVMRTMVAFDVISFQGLKEARGYQLARREAAKMGLNTWSKKGWDKVNEILYHTKERWREAELQAEEEGLSGVQKRRRIYELMEESRPQEMKEESYGFAAKGTFNHESEGTLGALTNALSGMLDAVNIRGVQPLRLVIPFTRIITNVVNNTLDYTPVGLIRAARGVRGFRTFEQSQLTKPAFKELTREERKTLIAKAALGITLTAAFQALHIAGAITITGGGPDDENKKRQLRESGWQPYSIKIGNKWYSYQYTPLVFMLGYLGNMNDADKYLEDNEDTFGKRIQLATSRIGGQVVDMTWINSASTFMGALAETNPEQQSKKVQNSLAGMARGFVPFSGFINQSSEAIQKIYNIPQKQVNNAWQGLIQNIPIARNSLNNKINALGEPIVRDIDVFVSTETKDPVWKFLLDKGGWVAPVHRGTLIKIDKNTGEEVPYTDDEYYEFSKLRGGKIKDDIEKMLKDDRFYVVRDGKAQYVTSEDVKNNELNEILTKIKVQATKEAKEELFGEKTIDKKESNQNKKWNEKINKIINNK